MEHYSFPNGIDLIINEMDYTRSISIGIFVPIGSEFERSEQNGLSHFVEHMLFKGTSNRDALKIALDIEKIGGNINAYTSRNHTLYYTTSLYEHAEKCMDVLSDIYFNSFFEEEELDKERGVIVEEIQMSEDSPEDFCIDNLLMSYYGDSGPGQLILGKQEVLKKITRKDLITFHREYYLSQPIVISIAGRIKREAAIDLVAKYFFRNLENRTFAVLEKNIIFPKYGTSIANKEIEQSNISVAYDSYGVCNPKLTAAKIMSDIFGGGMSSRLYQVIREKRGLAYNVYSSTYPHKNSGMLSVYLGTSKDLAQTAIIALKNEITNIKNNGFTEEEIQVSKESRKTTIILVAESAQSVMRLAGVRYLNFKDLFCIDEEIEKIEKISVKELNEIIDDSFSNNRFAISYVGKKLDFDIREMLS